MTTREQLIRDAASDDADAGSEWMERMNEWLNHQNMLSAVEVMEHYYHVAQEWGRISDE